MRISSKPSSYGQLLKFKNSANDKEVSIVVDSMGGASLAVFDGNKNITMALFNRKHGEVEDITVDNIILAFNSLK